MKIIDGGVTAAKGFKAAGMHAGIKKGTKKDMAMIVSSANTVEQDKWHINVFQGGDVGEIGCFLRQTGDDTFHAHIDQILNISFFVLVRLM